MRCRPFPVVEWSGPDKRTRVPGFPGPVVSGRRAFRGSAGPARTDRGQPSPGDRADPRPVPEPGDRGARPDRVVVGGRAGDCRVLTGDRGGAAGRPRGAAVRRADQRADPDLTRGRAASAAGVVGQGFRARRGVGAGGGRMLFRFFLAHQAFALRPLPLGDPSILRALFGVAGATVAAGLLGLAVGTLLRSTLGSIFAFVALLVVLPQALLGALPAAAQEFVLPLCRPWRCRRCSSWGVDATLASPLKATIVVGVWVILMMGGAAAVLHRRDV